MDLNQAQDKFKTCDENCLKNQPAVISLIWNVAGVEH